MSRLLVPSVPARVIDPERRRARERRRFLQALGAGTCAPLLGVFCNAFSREALGQPAARKVLFYVDGMGRPDKLWPSGNGPDFNLGAYAPLEPLRKDLLIVAGLYNPFNIHLHGSMHAWTCVNGIQGIKPGDNYVKPGGVSFDRALGAALSKGDPYVSLNVMVHNGPYRANAKPADGPEKSVPIYPGPVEAYEQVLAPLAAPPAVAGVVEPVAQRLAGQKSLFDFVVADVQRLKGRLAATERAKLDQYTESLRTFEQTLARLQAQSGGGTCQKPTPPDAKLKMPGQQNSPERMSASLDFAIAALSCGLTHVMKLHVGGGPLAFLGNTDIGTHTQGHSVAPELHVPYVKYHCDSLVALRSRLALLPDGGGKLADSTTIVYTDEHGGAHHNGMYRTWFMVLGGAGVMPTGRMLQLPVTKIVAGDPRAVPSGGALPQFGGIGVGTQAGATFLGDFFAGLATALGAKMDRFGAPEHAKAPVALAG